MKIIFNGLDLPFEFWNMRCKHEVWSILCFIKHNRTPLFLSLSIYILVSCPWIATVMSFKKYKYSYLHVKKERKDNLVININFNHEYIINIKKYRIERKVDI
jgi:hypothetical protein